MKPAFKRILFKIYKILPAKIRFLISYLYSDKFLVDVVAFIIKDNKLLLVKQSYQYSWGLVGGWVKREESIENSIKREVMEELGLRVKMKKVLEVRSSSNRPVIDIAVECEVIGGDSKIDGEEVEEVKFFDIKDLPKNILAPHRYFIDKFLTSEKHIKNPKKQ